MKMDISDWFANPLDGRLFEQQTRERVGALAITAAVVASLVVLAPATGAQSSDVVGLGDADTKVVGVAENDVAGQSVAAAGDLNGDGVEDLIVGVPGYDANAQNTGAAFVFFGPVERDEINLTEANVTLTGVESGDQAGKAVAPAGDLNGDGVDDVLVGAPTSDVNGTNSGAAYVVYGGTGLPASMSLADANATLFGERGDRAGTSVGNTTTPPANQSAVLVGAPRDDAGGEDAGAAFVVEGSVEGSVALEEESIAKLVGEDAGDRAGTSVAGVGEVTDDGSADVLVGAPMNDAAATDAGAAYIVGRALPAGGDGGPPEDRPNRDGPPDDRGSDRPFVVPLDRATVTLLGEAENDNAGHDVAAAGDVDADNVSDVVVGAPFHDSEANNTGAAYVVHGNSSLPDEVDLADADARLLGQDEGHYAGWSVAASSSGAANCDDVHDLLVGAPGYDDEETNSGAAYAVAGGESLSGSMSLDHANTTYVGESADDNAGHAVASVGDVDDDGIDDVGIGAPSEDSAAHNAGAAYVVNGECPEKRPGYGYGYSGE